MVQVTLCASSLGYLFPQNETQDLRLHSAFKHAVNLYSDAGTFITLLCAQTYLNLPDAARVWLPECWDWRREIAHSDPIQLTPVLTADTSILCGARKRNALAVAICGGNADT